MILRIANSFIWERLLSRTKCNDLSIAMEEMISI